MTLEHERRYNRTQLNSAGLSAELVELLSAETYACVIQPTDRGSAYLIRAPAAAIARARGTAPIYIRHQLFGYPTAPVIRTILTLYDYPNRPLSFESCIDIADPNQREAFSALAGEDHHLALFYDRHLRHRLSKQVSAGLDKSVPEILARADRLRAAIPPGLYDFDRAKAALQKERWP